MHAVTGWAPGAASRNIIPSCNCINPHDMQAMLKIMLLPNTDPTITSGTRPRHGRVIHIRKLNNIARVDWAHRG